MLGKMCDTEVSEYKFNKIKEDYKESLKSLVEHIHRVTDFKKIAGKLITGGILCNMAQSYVHSLQGRKPPLIYKAFERAIASEARRSKEKLFIEYMDKISLLEQTMPCDEESLFLEHHKTVKYLMGCFDKEMLQVFDQSEVQEERESLMDRIDAYFVDIKDSNMNQSSEKSKEVFRNLYDTLKDLKLSYAEDGTAKFDSLENALREAVSSYKENAPGPCAANVFLEEMNLVINLVVDMMKQINAKDEIEKEELSREILSLNRQKEEARLLETRLKAQIEEMNSNFEKQLELKDKHISDLQASINSKNYQFEARTREMVREIQGLKLELEQAQKERELMVEAEKDINDKRLSELESRLSKMNMENQKYEKQVDELREEHEKLLAEKNEIINELSRRVKLMESSPDSGFRIDSNVLKSLKIYLEDILSKFSKEENINSKYLAQLERFSNLQSEVNKLRLKEQETRNKLIEDYEDKIHRMKSDTDSINKELIDTLEREKETTVLTYENVATDLEILKKMNLDNEDQIRRLIEEKAEISTALKHAEEQLEDQSEVLEVQKKDLQRLRNELDDATMELEKVRNALQEEEGDNIKLLKIFRGAFELMTKKKGSLHALLTSIQREENYKGVTEILTKYKIPF
jgi:hypothetical protein